MLTLILDWAVSKGDFNNFRPYFYPSIVASAFPPLDLHNVTWHLQWRSTDWALHDITRVIEWDVILYQHLIKLEIMAIVLDEISLRSTISLSPPLSTLLWAFIYGFKHCTLHFILKSSFQKMPSQSVTVLYVVLKPMPIRNDCPSRMSLKT